MPGRAALDRGHGRRRGVVDVHERPHARRRRRRPGSALGDHLVLSPPRAMLGARPVEAAVAEHDPLRPGAPVTAASRWRIAASVSSTPFGGSVSSGSSSALAGPALALVAPAARSSGRRSAGRPPRAPPRAGCPCPPCAAGWWRRTRRRGCACPARRSRSARARPPRAAPRAPRRVTASRSSASATTGTAPSSRSRAAFGRRARHPVSPRGPPGEPADERLSDGAAGACDEDLHDGLLESTAP